MKALKISISTLAATAALALCGAAQAADRPLGLTFNIGAATDYVFRGVSQTDENPQVFAGADISAGIAYAGVWASNVDFNDSTDFEYDFYAGVKPVVGPVTLDLGVIYYGYHNQPDGADWDFTEFKLAASTAVGPATVGAAAFVSNDFTGGAGYSTYYEVNGAVPVGETGFTVSGAVGRQQLKFDADYMTWNLGVGYALNEEVGLDLRFWDTDQHNFGSIYESRVVFGIKATF